MNELLLRAEQVGQILPNPLETRVKLRGFFDSIWNEQRSHSSKLAYYNSAKLTSKIGFEPFLRLQDHSIRRSVMRLRSSSHRLNCETARYLTERELEKRGTNIMWEKRCKFCTSDEALSLSHLPSHDTIIEDENHILVTCPKFHAPRTTLRETTKSLLLRNEDYHLLYQPEHILHFGRFVKKVFNLRFPKKTKECQKNFHYTRNRTSSNCNFIGQKHLNLNVNILLNCNSKIITLIFLGPC